MKKLVLISMLFISFVLSSAAQPLFKEKDLNTLLKSMIKEDSIISKAETCLKLKKIITPEIQTLAQKMGFTIYVDGEHPKGGFNITVCCPKLKGNQVIQGVDSSSITRDGFEMTRGVDLEQASIDYNTAYVVSGGKVEEKPKKVIEIIDSTSYLFTKDSVQRIVTMKDGRIDRELVLP